MGKETVPNSIHSTWHTQNGSNVSVSWISAGKGPHVLDGQFLQLMSSGSKAKSLNNDCVGTLQLNRRDITQTVKEKKPEKGRLTAQHSSPVPILKSWSRVTKRCGNDFNLSWGQNRKKSNKTCTGKGKACISSTQQQKYDRRWSRRPLLQPYLLGKKENDQMNNDVYEIIQ